MATIDSFRTEEDATLQVSGPGVLANDSDAVGDPLSAVLVPGAGPSFGTLSLSADGSFSHTPHADFHGTDGFQY